MATLIRPTDARPVIVHVINSLDGGGTQCALVRLLRAMDPRKNRHVVVTLRDAGDLAADLPDHVACHALGAVGTSRTAWWKLARITRFWKASVVHARNTGCWSDALMATTLARGATPVLGFHGSETGRPLSRRVCAMGRIATRLGARWTSVSFSGRRQMCAQIGLTEEAVHVLPNGVSLDDFTKPSAPIRQCFRDSHDWGDDAFVVVSVGALTEIKRPGLLIEAVASLSTELPRLRLLFVGSGPLLGTLRRQTRSLGVEFAVRFVGWRDDVPAILASADAFVCASDYEGMSNALLEAMAAGLPVVATDVGDNAMVLRSGADGIVTPAGSARALSDAMRSLVRRPDLCDTLSAAARDRVRSFCLQRSVANYESYYEAITASSRRDLAHRPDGRDRQFHAWRNVAAGSPR